MLEECCYLKLQMAQLFSEKQLVNLLFFFYYVFIDIKLNLKTYLSVENTLRNLFKTCFVYVSCCFCTSVSMSSCFLKKKV